MCSTLYDCIPGDEKRGQKRHTSALNTSRSACNLQPPPPPRVSLIPRRCTSLLFQQSKFAMVCVYRLLQQLSLGLLTIYNGILNGRWGGGGGGGSENTHTNLHHLLCDSVEILPTQPLAQKYTHMPPPLPSLLLLLLPPTHAGIRAVLTLPSRQA